MRRRFSRLTRIEEKKDQKKAIWYLMITCGLIVVLISWGTPLLSKVFLWITGSQTQSTVFKSDNIPPSPPQIFVTFEATNSATTNLKGIAEPGSSVFITHNTNQTFKVIAGDDGQFVLEDIVLTEGDNKIVSVAMDNEGNRSQESEVVNIRLSSQKPNLEIFSPLENQTFNGSANQKIVIKGKTDPENTLFINDRMIILPISGNFEYRFNCNPGLNTVTIIATNIYGSQSVKVLNLTYNP